MAGLFFLGLDMAPRRLFVLRFIWEMRKTTRTACVFYDGVLAGVYWMWAEVTLYGLICHTEAL